jgi:2,5-diketo-D-gluconate reductase B
MEFVTARDGASAPALGFGTWQLAGSECRALVADALAMGYRHLDTAQMYENEDAVGAGLAVSGVPRDQVFLTTKLSLTNLAAARVARSTEESLRRLRVDQVDLLLIHWPSSDVPWSETLDAMLALRERGRTHHVGVSNFPIALLREVVARYPGEIACNQIEFHVFLAQDEQVRFAGEHGLFVTAYSPLAKGRVADDPVLREIGAHHGKSASQVALRWLVQQHNVAAIPKTASRQRARANLEIFDIVLSAGEMARIRGLDVHRRLVSPEFAPLWDR